MNFVSQHHQSPAVLWSLCESLERFRDVRARLGFDDGLIQNMNAQGSGEIVNTSTLTLWSYQDSRVWLMASKMETPCWQTEQPRRASTSQGWLSMRLLTDSKRLSPSFLLFDIIRFSHLHQKSKETHPTCNAGLNFSWTTVVWLPCYLALVSFSS